MTRWPVYKGRLRVAWALVDDADVALIELHLWRLHPGGYATTFLEGTKRNLYMHRVILPSADGAGVDHIDGDGLNNQRSNLRAITHAQNMQNRRSRGLSSQYRGVTWFRDRQMWRASAMLDGRTRRIGYFPDELAAARAASEWRAEHMPHSNEERFFVESEEKETV